MLFIKKDVVVRVCFRLCQSLTWCGESPAPSPRGATSAGPCCSTWMSLIPASAHRARTMPGPSCPAQSASVFARRAPLAETVKKEHLTSRQVTHCAAWLPENWNRVAQKTPLVLFNYIVKYRRDKHCYFLLFPRYILFIIWKISFFSIYSTIFSWRSVNI